MHIAQSCPHNRSKVVVQDLPPTTDQAKAFWNDTAPDFVKEKRVEFIPFDFLKDDAAPGCDIYYVRYTRNNRKLFIDSTILICRLKVFCEYSSCHDPTD